MVILFVVAKLALLICSGRIHLTLLSFPCKRESNKSCHCEEHSDEAISDMKRKAHRKSRTNNPSSNPIFSGEYRVCVSRNRVTFPQELYNQLVSVDGSSELWLARSPKGCIVIVPGKFWDVFCETITENKTPTVREHLVGTYIEPAKTVDLSSQRRFTIPHSFILSLLGEAERVVVVGVCHWIEIWAEKRWERHLAQLEENV